ncbi:MAG: thioredoxin family protein [Candidatus Melainabacteria bacterium]|nr:thioredoxin family protein [Candidatus Melainabacteria bacterium]
MSAFNSTEIQSRPELPAKLTSERQGISLLGISFDFMPGRGAERTSGTDALPKKIEWESDVTSALTRAQKEHKPLVVVFKEDRCGWCKLFADELQKPEVGAIAKDAVYLQVTPSTNSEAKQLANLCKVEGYPTVSVLSVEGGVISPVSKIAGFMDSTKFINHMRLAFASVNGNRGNA